MSTTTDEAMPDVTSQTAHHASVYIYQAPLRIWHWVNALCILVLGVTGYLIGSPPPSVQGEAIDSFLFGYIRFAHFTAAYIFCIGFLFRIYWAIVGNHHAKQLFTLPFWRIEWWREIGVEVAWYLFLRREPKKYLGHNPLAHLVMFFMITALSVFMICTGFALYAEGTGTQSWQYALFGWVFLIFPNSQDVHTWHHLGLWAFVIFTMVHVYAAIREDIMSRQSIISTMISGRRMFKDDRP